MLMEENGPFELLIVPSKLFLKNVKLPVSELVFRMPLDKTVSVKSRKVLALKNLLYSCPTR